ncbi:MAG: hypothetical protein NXI01_03215 [Gammaproteobacteria bacterium]|nr:hypothetical protein [Gammaproteobacteria bacterium]
MQNIMYLALGFFVLAIFFGFIVFIQLLCDRPSFKPAVFLHGLVATLGLGCLVTYTILHAGEKPIAALIVLLLAATGGLTLLNFDLRKKPIPKLLVLLHPLFALIGLGLLIAYLFK